MSFSSQNISTFLSVVLSGLLAGLFYGYACSVNIGISKLSDLEYLKAMQSINRVILNPAFFISFFGTLLFIPIATWFSYVPNPPIQFYFLLSASVIYAAGVVGVTFIGNVPLNEALAIFDIEKASIPELFSQREKFEAAWNNFHLIRTLAAVSSFILTILSLIKCK